VNTLENYAFVNRLLIEVINEFAGQVATLGLLMHEPQVQDIHSKHFCMAKPTKYDVMIEGKKVGGGAQRRTKSGFLHQGTLSLALPDVNFLQKILLPDTCVFRSMQQNSYALLEGKPSAENLLNARIRLKEIFKKVIL
jgi:lipoate-protein ligase A